MKAVKTVTEYLERHAHFEREILLLRELALGLGVNEAIKWGAPCYTLDGKNVFGIAAFKNYVGIWFFHGVFLKDTQKLLVNAQKDKTVGMRQMRFDSLKTMDAKLITSYLQEAIDNQKAGKIFKASKNTQPVVVPDELKAAFTTNLDFKSAFDGFTVSKQREYADYISEAKQAATKQKRLEKIIPMILKGIGLHDKYKNC